MASVASHSIASSLSHAHEAEFDVLLETMQTRVDVAFAGREPIFKTNAASLFTAFLNWLPADDRQSHVCHACERFIKRFGGLVVITDDGQQHPLFWRRRLFRTSIVAGWRRWKRSSMLQG